MASPTTKNSSSSQLIFFIMLLLTNLVTRIREVFPEYPAFGAVPERAVPHVTIGKRAPLSELKTAEAEEDDHEESRRIVRNEE